MVKILKITFSYKSLNLRGPTCSIIIFHWNSLIQWYWHDIPAYREKRESQIISVGFWSFLKQPEGNTMPDYSGFFERKILWALCYLSSICWFFDCQVFFYCNLWFFFIIVLKSMQDRLGWFCKMDEAYYVRYDCYLCFHFLRFWKSKQHVITKRGCSTQTWRMTTY